MPLALTTYFFIELFAGSCHLSTALKKSGLTSFAFDIKISEFHDLLQPGLYAWLRGALRSRRCLGIWFALPCGTYSRARRGGGSGPPPLRDDHDHILGFDNLSDKDLLRVRLANALTARVVKLCKLCVKCGVPFFIENPLTSRLWIVPIVKELIALHNPLLTRFDFCQYDMPWRKATRILHWGCPELAVGARWCSSRTGFCTRSGKRHFTLTGTDDKGVFWTARSEPYPAKLCRAWAARIREHALAAAVHNKFRALCRKD